MANLVYIIAFDAPGCGGYRAMAKICASSLLRTFFSGDMIVFRNTPAPLFFVERKGLEEIFVETPEIAGPVLREWTQRWKHRARRYFEASAYDTVIYLDCDSIALRDIDPLFEGDDWEIRQVLAAGKAVEDINDPYGAWFHEEELDEVRGRQAAAPWLFAVRGDRYEAIMEEWERWDAQIPIGATTRKDLSIWNRLLANLDQFPYWAHTAEARSRDSSMGDRNASRSLPRCKPFSASNVVELGSPGSDYHTFSQATLLHCGGGSDGPFDVEERVRFLFGMWMRTFHCDAAAQLMHLLES